MMDREAFVKLGKATMPFGRYKGRRLLDLHETYLVWFQRHGWPEGELGRQMAAVYEIKLNGLERLFRKP